MWLLAGAGPQSPREAYIIISEKIRLCSRLYSWSLYVHHFFLWQVGIKIFWFGKRNEGSISMTSPLVIVIPSHAQKLDTPHAPASGWRRVAYVTNSCYLVTYVTTPQILMELNLVVHGCWMNCPSSVRTFQTNVLSPRQQFQLLVDQQEHLPDNPTCHLKPPVSLVLSNW